MSGQPVTSASLRLNHSLEAGERARFLIVDDEPALLRAMRRVLHAAGPNWAVVCARHGVEALECLSHEPFDAVLLDLHMPVMDGITLLRHLVAQYPEVRRIVHSSHIDPIGRGVLAELAHEVLAKPAHPASIVDALERSLRRGATPVRASGPVVARKTSTC
ncbi:MAG TPA: response regulator [Polyangiaceae bacterium]